LKFDNLRRKFLWQGSNASRKFPLLKWKEVCTPYNEGGADIKNLEIVNKALLGKWIWRFVVEMNNLWHQIIAAKYGTSPTRWWTNESSLYRASFIWKCIAKMAPSVLNKVSYSLGSGSGIRFWMDL